MKPCNFHESNVTLTAPEGVPGILPLPIHRTLMPDEVTSCWELEPGDIEEIQRTGRVWLVVAGRTHTPLRLDVRPPFPQRVVAVATLDPNPETMTVELLVNGERVSVPCSRIEYPLGDPLEPGEEL